MLNNNNNVTHLESLKILGIKWLPPSNQNSSIDNSTYTVTLLKRDGSKITVGDHVAQMKSLNELNQYFYLSNPYVEHSWSQDIWNTIREQKVFIGMTKEQAEVAWGIPEKINKTITLAGSSEQWVYGLSSYLYFDNGILTAIQN